MSDVQRKEKFRKTALKLKINNGSSYDRGPITPSINHQSDSPLGAIEELLQCGICLERLNHPRMLPCQHTFCLNCLNTHVTAKNLRVSTNQTTSTAGTVAFKVAGVIKSMSCPVCQKPVPIPDGIASLDRLPKNLYLESLLRVVEGSPTSPKVVDNFRCVHCQMVSEQQEQVCQHCMQIFCSVCWNQHLTEIETNQHILVKQLEESQERLTHKYESFLGRCQTLTEKIRKATKQKIETTLSDERAILEEVDSLRKESAITSEILFDGIKHLQETIERKSQDQKSNTQKVTTYLKLHRETSKLLDQVSYFGEARLTFDPDSFKLDQISEGTYEEISDPQPQPTQALLSNVIANPTENIESMVKYYKAKSFTPKFIWNKCPRPAGLGIPPWDENKLFIAATDSHYVLIFDKNKFKLIDRLLHTDMICPIGLAFYSIKKQIFVSDKWRHCIHVFSSEQHYLHQLSVKLRGPEGLAMGPNEQHLIVCDTGNDRILLVNPQTGEKVGVIGAYNGITHLNFPTSVAVFERNVIVADSGNHKVRVYNIQGELLQEIGCLGKNPGQFRSAEVVTVDPLGFILVGDAGNARIQVFKPDGNVVKIIGSKSGFGWVSGLLVTSKLEVITSDNKNRCLRIF
ncbi:hypothetical protein ABEB36_006839 [Hypothenemus hampei]|uniref:RING-type domain-containing protein n=1 Tax=Hypothenemus hampei TaxID=57062 RepID=A0ABD1ESP9_HYPHA